MKTKLPEYKVKNIYTGQVSDSFSDEQNDAVKLASLAITFRNHLATEFGVADYWDDKLTRELDLLGVEYLFKNNKEIMELKNE